MICDSCRDGGNYNQLMMQAAEARSFKAEGLHLAAIRSHARCEAPTTCPCQHRTGQHVKP